MAGQANADANQLHTCRYQVDEISRRDLRAEICLCASQQGKSLSLPQQCMLDGLADVQVVSMYACNIYTVLTTLQLCCIGKLYFREKLCKMICEATALHPWHWTHTIQVVMSDCVMTYFAKLHSSLPHYVAVLTGQFHTCLIYKQSGVHGWHACGC